MCGIAGVFSKRAPEIVEDMLASLIHRGPDDGHWVQGEAFTLGARRLSIMDIAGGRQPLGSPDGRYWACQNGEIYNFKELDLPLQSGCDTEVLPLLYQRYGAQMVDHLQGMFAFAVWDTQTGQGLLARDRSGKKPLYYTIHQGALWFASEIKALLRIPGFQRRLNQEAVEHFLALKHVPAPLTAFKGIHQLPPGHRLLWDGQRSRVERYWRLNWSPGKPVGDPQSELLEKLGTAVRRRMIADVPVGFFLSGGLDSSLCTVLAARHSPVKTFTLRYRADSSTPGKELDLACARQVAGQFATEHLEEEVDFSSFREELPTILGHFDEPFGGVVSTYFLARLIARHVKVAISGDGADELFGSYLTHRLAPALEKFRAGQLDQLGPEFTARQDFLASLACQHPWEWRSRLSVFSDEEKTQLLTRPPESSTQDYWRTIFADLTASPEDVVNQILEAEFLTQLPDQVLTFSDRLSMAHSLEIRCPFLDTDFMEFAAGLPGHLKVQIGHTKMVLKQAAAQVVPREVWDRPKEGFVMPVNQWLESWLLDYARQQLSPTQLERHGLFQPQQVQGILDRFAQGERRLANQVLSLLCFQIWFGLYF
jgi:asparagine synthase (glutamine-hydrolysing)